MEYGEAVNEAAAEAAFRIALGMQAEGADDLRAIATKAVTRAYCVCVTDGEDAAEHRLSKIHADLIDRLVRRLAARAVKERI